VTAIGAVATATIGGSFTVLAYRVRRENNATHESNRRVLDSIDRRTEAMDASWIGTVRRSRRMLRGIVAGVTKGSENDKAPDPKAGG
jgi:hypothetical protein